MFDKFRHFYFTKIIIFIVFSIILIAVDRYYTHRYKYKMLKVLLAISLIGLVAFLAKHDHNGMEKYDLWKNQFGLKYSLAEDSFRRIIFLRNIDLIEKHNKD